MDVERRASRWVLAALLAGGVLAGCSDSDGDGDADPGISADAAAAQVEAAREEFCAATETHVAALDQYGRLFDQSALTVGDVASGGGTIVASEAAVLSAAADYDAAVERATAAAEREAAEAAEGSTTLEPPTTTTFPPLAPPEDVEEVQQADAAFDEAIEGVDESTPLVEATIEVTSAAYALEVAWARLFADAGCLDDPAGARAQVSEYVSGIQTDLTTAGYYAGDIDGLYGPETADAVRQFQAAAGLPTTGTPDPPTQLALNQALANQESASIAALQGILAGLGFYAGPIDGVWSAEVEDALIAFQTEAGEEPTGTVTIETLIALQQLLAGATTTTTTAPEETTTTVPAEPAAETTTTTTP